MEVQKSAVQTLFHFVRVSEVHQPHLFNAAKICGYKYSVIALQNNVEILIVHKNDLHMSGIKNLILTNAFDLQD